MKKKIVFDILKIGITIAILALVFKKFQIGFTDITASLGHRPLFFLAALIAQVGAISFAILRWKVLLAGQSLDVPMSRAIETFMIGRFLGTFTPTGIGLEAYKAYDVARYTGRPEASVSVVLIEKLIGTFFSLGLLGLVTLPFFAGALEAGFLYAFGAFFAGLFAAAMVLLFNPGALRAILKLRFPLKDKVAGPLERVVDAFTVYSRRKGCLVTAVLLGLVVYLFWFLTYYASNLALGAGLALVQVLEVGPLTQIATMIPLSISGIGLREGAFMGLLDILGAMDGATAGTRTAMMLSATMVYFVSVAVNLVGAVFFLRRRSDRSKRSEKPPSVPR